MFKHAISTFIKFISLHHAYILHICWQNTSMLCSFLLSDTAITSSYMAPHVAITAKLVMILVYCDTLDSFFLVL